MAPPPPPDRLSALRAERLVMLQFCSALSDDEWLAPSTASGWQVKDVVAHLGGGCHSLFTPALLKMLRSRDIERTNDALVANRRSWEPRAVLNEFATWSAHVTRLASVVASTPLTGLRLPLAELGSFRLGLLVGAAMVFDQHTHLRFDMAPAIGQVAPPTDANRMSVVVEWMLAVLSNQLRGNPPRWMTRPVGITLTRPGGGCWSVTGNGTITPGAVGPAGAHIVAPAQGFPEWATQRARWRDRDVAVSGDAEYGARFLDSVNIV